MLRECTKAVPNRGAVKFVLKEEGEDRQVCDVVRREEQRLRVREEEAFMLKTSGGGGGSGGRGRSRSG